MADIPDFLYEKDGALLFKPDKKEFLLYIPEKYFERGMATQNGEFIDFIGVADWTIQDINEEGVGVKNNGLHRFNCPTILTTRPYTTDKVKQIKMIKTSKPLDYRILRYRKGDMILQSTKVTQDIVNVEKFNNLFYVLGFIINTVSYDKIYEYIINAMSLNGNSYGLSAQMFGFTYGEVCRSLNDPSIPYRLSGSNDPHAYQSMSVKNVSKLTSPYTALISEDFDESVLYAMMNESPRDTPLEKILVGE